MNREFFSSRAGINRSIIICSLLSILVHVSIVVILLMFFDVINEPHIKNISLILDIVPDSREGENQSNDSLTEITDDKDPVNPEKSIESGNPVKQKHITSAENRMTPVPENTISDLKQELHKRTPAELAETDSEKPAAGDFPVIEEEHRIQDERSFVLTTLEQSNHSTIQKQTEQPQAVPEKVSLSLKQQKMFNKKFKKWGAKFYAMDLPEPGTAWKYRGQEYTAIFKQIPAEDNTGIDKVIVEISTQENGVNMSTRVNMRRLSFSSYAQFVDKWDPYVSIHNDELDGRFHSNTRLYLDYDRKASPVFHGKVTTASLEINSGRAKRRVKKDRIFLGGLETGVKRILLPKNFIPFPDDKTVNEEQVQYFEEDTRITFYQDGSFGWRSGEVTAGERKRVIPGSSFYILGARKKKIYVKGIVKGKILIYSPERIIIEDDLVYADYPDTSMTSGNYLGLVSDKYVEIAPPDITGAGDLYITASIYARSRFIVRRYGVKQNAILYVYGSVAAGSFSATEPRFNTKIQFDRRLEKIRPPGFPMTNRYEIEQWDGMWELKNRL